jgi:hypothetical protein
MSIFSKVLIVTSVSCVPIGENPFLRLWFSGWHHVVGKVLTFLGLCWYLSTILHYVIAQKIIILVHYLWNLKSRVPFFSLWNLNVQLNMKISLTEMKVTNKENILSHPREVGLLLLWCGTFSSCIWRIVMYLLNKQSWTADKGMVLQHVTKSYTISCI